MRHFAASTQSVELERDGESSPHARGLTPDRARIEPPAVRLVERCVVEVGITARFVNACIGDAAVLEDEQIQNDRAVLAQTLRGRRINGLRQLSRRIALGQHHLTAVGCERLLAAGCNCLQSSHDADERQQRSQEQPDLAPARTLRRYTHENSMMRGPSVRSRAMLTSCSVPATRRAANPSRTSA